MDHVSQWIATLFTLTNHPFDVLPRIAIVLHGLNNLNNSIYILHILFNEFRLDPKDILLFLQFFHPLLLISFDLLVLLPSNILQPFFLFVLHLLVLRVIFTGCLVECPELDTLYLGKFYVLEWLIFKVLNLWFIFGTFFLLDLFLGLLSFAFDVNVPFMLRLHESL